MHPLHAHDLYNKNTENAALRIFCWPERQCCRLGSCVCCKSRKRKFIVSQVQKVAFEWDLRFFATVTMQGFVGDGQTAIKALQQIRKAH